MSVCLPQTLERRQITKTSFKNSFVHCIDKLDIMKNGLKYFLAFAGLAIIQQLMRELGFGSMLYIALTSIPFAYYSYLRAIETKNSKIASVIMALLIFIPAINLIVIGVLIFANKDKKSDIEKTPKSELDEKSLRRKQMMENISKNSNENKS